MLELARQIRETVESGWKGMRNASAEPKAALERKAAKLLAGFFVLMLVFTVLSRVADSLTVAKVQVTSPQNAALMYEVEADGVIESKKEISIPAQEGLRILDVPVEEGQEVRKGDLLIEFDAKDIEKQLLQAEDELQKLILQQKQQKLDASSGSETLSREQSLQAAQEDYDAAVQSAALAVYRAQQDLIQAREAYKAAKAEAGHLDDASRQNAIDSAKAALNSTQRNYDDTVYSRTTALRDEQRKVEDAQADLAAAEATGDAAAIAAAQTVLDRAREDQNAVSAHWEEALARAQADLEQAQRALQTAQNGTGSDDLPSLETARRAVENAERALQDAIENQTAQELTAQRAIENAQTQLDSAERDAENHAAKAEYQQQSLDIDIHAKQREVEELKALYENNVLTAPEDGMLLSFSIEVGQRTNGEEVVRMAAQNSGYKFRTQLGDEEADHVALGDEIALTIDGRPMPVKAKIESLSLNYANKTAELTATLPEGSYLSGESATMNVWKRSKNYNACLPISAIRQDSGGEYILIVHETNTVLGKELVVSRINVIVADRDATTVAVSGGIGPEDRVIVSSSKPINIGDRIRVTEK